MNYKVFQLLKLGKERLLKSKLPEIEARFLMEFLLKKSFTELINCYQDDVDESIVEKYHDLIQKRLTGIPLQHITNEQYFYGNSYYVNEHVLIPRPETEMLVDSGIEYITQRFHKGKRHFRVVDMCTGSGCIALSIGNYFANEASKFQDIDLEILGVDISKEALKVARMNSNNIYHNNSVCFVESDLFKNVTWSDIDLFLSNPPYITPDEINNLSSEVKDYEPILALDGGNDGLEFYRLISSESFDKLGEDSMIIYEIGHGQMTDVIKILEDCNYKGVNGKMDFQNLERLVYGIKLNKPD